MEKISGEVMDIHYDEKIEKLNLGLARDKCNSPVILFEDWTKEGEHLLTLHIKEALELKAIIDKLVFDYTMELEEKLGENNAKD